jgi:hypothetical protein
MKRSEWQKKPRPMKIGMIAQALLSLSNVDEKTSESSKKTLAYAAEFNDWNLVSEAALFLARIIERPNHEPIEIDDEPMLTMGLALSIMNEPGKYGLDDVPKKADILDIMRLKFPDFCKSLPTSKRGLTDWWKRVDCGAEQARGYESSILKKMKRNP